MRDFAASYSDLDELLVEHVKAMADKVEALIHHEKYRKEGEIGTFRSIFVFDSLLTPLSRSLQRNI